MNESESIQRCYSSFRNYQMVVEVKGGNSTWHSLFYSTNVCKTLINYSVGSWRLSERRPLKDGHWATGEANRGGCNNSDSRDQASSVAISVALHGKVTKR